MPKAAATGKGGNKFRIECKLDAKIRIQSAQDANFRIMSVHDVDGIS